MRELRPGLWTWTARHPAWTTPDEGWGPDVRSYELATEGALVLVDPLEPPPAVAELAAGREVVVLLTVSDHQRSAGECAAELGARVYAPEQAVPKIATAAVGFAVGDVLPGGIVAQTGFRLWPHEATLWSPAYRALFTGDVLLNEDGLSVPRAEWFGDAATREEVRAELRPLLDLPVELVLPTHGDPVVEDAHARLAAAFAG